MKKKLVEVKVDSLMPDVAATKCEYVALLGVKAAQLRVSLAADASEAPSRTAIGLLVERHHVSISLLADPQEVGVKRN